MRIHTVLATLFGFLTIPVIACSSDLESLQKQGYELVGETRVVGDYQGCTASTYLRFTNGKAFVCSTFGFDNSQYMPVVFIFSNKDGAIKVLINGKDYSGSFIDTK